jgi:hypothetical protein
LTVLQLRTDDDKDSCFRLLQSNENKTLCQGIYNDKYLNAAIKYTESIEKESYYCVITKSQSNVAAT